ncbi:type IX secretion system plug protein [Aureibacter tunicatorum]|uniref:Type 9 secretion system plug protein N-terminal domain-containing protein n=1 Tax=Aureibacter tunicatorum TaxID=866807 RepID=A0AAE3XKV6_9BACT|nr:DUF5103 domain-containing protein [Aureibacter tunicatorum]MDR6238385.1 hypothetical protein [Aureibacter tunicatorum]BDD03417.1 DUF5103 domain-containing protein [Aureibacter tunicatorum]
MRKQLFLTIISLISLLPSALSQSISEGEVLKDINYDEYLKTIQLYPYSGDLRSTLFSPVISLSSNNPLVLEFDEVEADVQTYRARIIHCNADWTKSRLMPMDYLYDFNEFDIDEYEYSFNTKIDYIHYTFKVPKVKKSGNYILAVYRESQELVFTRRFMVTEDRVSVQANVIHPNSPSRRFKDQRLMIEVLHPNLHITQPNQQIKMVVVKNQDWFTAKTELKPTRNRIDEAKLIYDHIDGSNEFNGGNEYRFFDLRTISFPSQNIGSIKKGDDYNSAFVFIDKIRDDRSYTMMDDFNGGFYIANREVEAGLISSDYVNTTFSLRSNKLPAGHHVYVRGKFTNWNLLDEFKMRYDKNLKGYTCTAFIKQGFYNYEYFVQGPNMEPSHFEGNFFETENEYEIFIYFWDQTQLIDKLVGYSQIISNKRAR